MTRVNVGRITLGGAAAAAVLYLVAWAVNGGLLCDDWKSWMNATSTINHFPGQLAALVLWAIECIVLGFTGVWIYAGIRPRYGKGPRTAVLAGLLLWLAGWASAALDRTALGSIPAKIIVVDLAGGLVAALLAVLIGAWIYKE